jgi:hypothetical protein
VRIVERLRARKRGYNELVCVACAMAAATGATGARTWLQNSHATWLTPRRMRVATIAMIGAAFAVSTVGLSGSTPSPHPAGHATGPNSAPVVAHPH